MGTLLSVFSMRSNSFRAARIPLMAVLKKIKRAVRGEVKLTTAAREVLRRAVASLNERKERAGHFDNEPLALKPVFARMSNDELLAHFQSPRQAKFFDDFAFASSE